MKVVAYDVKDPPGSEVSVGFFCSLTLTLSSAVSSLWNFFFSDFFHQVIQIKNIHSEQPLVGQVYADSGREIMGSTVAAPFDGKLLIGTAVHKALLCNLK